VLIHKWSRIGERQLLTDELLSSQSTGIDLLLQSNFDLKINDAKFRVEVPEDSE